MGTAAGSIKHFLLVFEPRARGVRVRLTSRDVSVDLVAASGEDAGTSALQVVGKHVRPGEVVEVRCGSRLLGSARDAEAIESLVRRAVAPLA